MDSFRSARILGTTLGRCFERTRYRIVTEFSDGVSHEISRRYSEFRQLHDTLQAGGQALPDMPPKSHFRKRACKDFMRERQSQLELLLNSLVAQSRAGPFATHINMFLGLEPARDACSLVRVSVPKPDPPELRPPDHLYFYQVASADVPRMEELHRCVTDPNAPLMLGEPPRRRPIRMVPWTPKAEAHALALDERSKRQSYATGVIRDRWFYLKQVDVTVPTDQRHWVEFDKTEEKAFSRAFRAKNATQSGFLAEFGPEERKYHLFVANESVTLQNGRAIETGLAKGSLGANSVAGYSLDLWQ